MNSESGLGPNPPSSLSYPLCIGADGPDACITPEIRRFLSNDVMYPFYADILCDFRRPDSDGSVDPVEVRMCAIKREAALAERVSMNRHTSPTLACAAFRAVVSVHIDRLHQELDTLLPLIPRGTRAWEATCLRIITLRAELVGLRGARRGDSS